MDQLLRRDLREEHLRPGALDTILSKHLLDLSLGDRNALQEEIHSVNCHAPKETPELLQRALQELAIVLDSDATMPPESKVAYLRSQKMQSTHVNSTAFRLRFLRVALFDATLAAKKMVSFLDIGSHVFGDIFLERPVRLSDLTKEELQYMRDGKFQFLPFRDRSGRRIVVSINPKQRSVAADENENRYFRSQAKIFLYMGWAGGDDIDSQRMGIVWVIWYDEKFKGATTKWSDFKNKLYDLDDLFPVRLGACHICSPDTPAQRFLSAIMMLKANAKNRIRMRQHFGHNTELLSILQSFGIPTKHMPLSFTGTIKTVYMKQWLRARETIESPVYARCILTNHGKDVIECPRLHDVLFRQGISLLWNPGNAMVRSFIEKHFEEEYERNNSEGAMKLKRSAIIHTVVQETQKHGRFLLWNDGGWWSEICDDEQLFMKVAYLVKSVRTRKDRKRQEQLNLQSSTSIFRQKDNTTTGNKRRFDDANSSCESGNEMKFSDCSGSCFKFG